MKASLVILGAVAGTLSPTLVSVAGEMQPLDWVRTRRYTRYAAAAYCSGALLENFECRSCTGMGGRYLTSMGNSFLDTSGYIAVDESDRRIVVAFRGTRGAVNTLIDVFAVPVPVLGGPLGSLVHAGFNAAMESMATSFLPAIRSLLAQPEYAGYTVAVVGHSLGGAIASLAAVKLHTGLGVAWERMELYTYGQPRVGNFVFAKWLSQQPIGSSRVVHHNDPVPHLAPGALSLYAHHQNEMWIRGKDSLATIRCRNDTLEDAGCSHSVPLGQLDAEDHTSYFQITVGRDAC